MSSDTSFLINSTLGLGLACGLQAEGIKLAKENSEYAFTLRVLGKTGQSLIAVPAIYSLCQAVSKLATSKMPELASAFGSGFPRGLAYGSAIAFSAFIVLAPTVLELAKAHLKTFQGKSDLYELADTLDYVVSAGVKAINLVHLVALSIFSGMSVPIAIGIIVSALTILPTLVEKFG